MYNDLNCRMENVKSTTFVVFIYHMAQVTTVDCEAIKVHLAACYHYY